MHTNQLEIFNSILCQANVNTGRHLYHYLQKLDWSLQKIFMSCFDFVFRLARFFSTRFFFHQKDKIHRGGPLKEDRARMKI